MARDLLYLLQSLKFEKLSLCGFSMGGQYLRSAKCTTRKKLFTYMTNMRWRWSYRDCYAAVAASSLSRCKPSTFTFRSHSCIFDGNFPCHVGGKGIRYKV